jgi:DNA-binding response OmpR family regulator
VLVVDDDPSIRLLCRVNLELDGYRALDAGTLAEARELLEAEQIDALLLDVHIGGEDGYALLDELRAADRDVPAALLTGTEEIDPRGAQAKAVLRKPFTIEDLTETVCRLTGSSCRADVDSHITG